MVSSIDGVDGVHYTDSLQIEEAFVNHFKCTLSPVEGPTSDFTNLAHVAIHGKLSSDDRALLSRPVELAEIENDVKFSSPNKALGPDGFAHIFSRFVGQ